MGTTVGMREATVQLGGSGSSRGGTCGGRAFFQNDTNSSA